MKVRELIELLKEQDLDAVVVMTGEHGDTSPFDSLGKGFYQAQTTWNGDWSGPDDEEATGVAAVYLQAVN